MNIDVNHTFARPLNLTWIISYFDMKRTGHSRHLGEKPKNSNGDSDQMWNYLGQVANNRESEAGIAQGLIIVSRIPIGSTGPELVMSLNDMTGKGHESRNICMTKFTCTGEDSEDFDQDGDDDGLEAILATSEQLLLIASIFVYQLIN